jgi:tetratricopeptide (TPR) repeat protein
VVAQIAVADERVLFSPDMPPVVNALLQQAVAAYEDSERAEQLLWQAQALDPEQPATYIALYKFYFYKNRLAEAEDAVRLALAQAARAGGFSEDWRRLTVTTADWTAADGPERAYLYGLKALAFIRLRQGDNENSSAILARLEQLDPVDQVGGSVIRQLVSVMEDSDD